MGGENEGPGRFCNGPRKDLGTLNGRKKDAEDVRDVRGIPKINVKGLQNNVLWVILHCVLI